MHLLLFIGILVSCSINSGSGLIISSEGGGIYKPSSDVVLRFISDSPTNTGWICYRQREKDSMAYRFYNYDKLIKRGLGSIYMGNVSVSKYVEDNKSVLQIIIQNAVTGNSGLIKCRDFDGASPESGEYIAIVSDGIKVKQIDSMFNMMLLKITVSYKSSFGNFSVTTNRGNIFYNIIQISDFGAKIPTTETSMYVYISRFHIERESLICLNVPRNLHTTEEYKKCWNIIIPPIIYTNTTDCTTQSPNIYRNKRRVNLRCLFKTNNITREDDVVCKKKIFN